MMSQDQVRHQPTLNLKFHKDYQQNRAGLSSKLDKKVSGASWSQEATRKAGQARIAKAAKAKRVSSNR